MRLFIFLFLTVTSLNIVRAQNTGCPRIVEGSTIHDISANCFPHDRLRVSIEYGSSDGYFNIVRHDDEVLLLLLRVQRTEQDKYTPGAIRNLTEHLVLNARRQLWEDIAIFGNSFSRESVTRKVETYEGLGRIIDFECTNDEDLPCRPILSKDLSQSRLDELHDWLVSNKIEDFPEIDPLVNNCPITGDLTPLLEFTQECAVWNR